LDPPVDLMSENMRFADVSLWGQFIDRYGNLNERVYSKFINDVEAAQTTKDLVNAFPYKVLMVKDPIKKYYDFYRLESGSHYEVS
jgi:hypothetical protein